MTRQHGSGGELPVQVVPFPVEDSQLRAAAAGLLVEEFRQHWPDAWPTIADATKEIDQVLHPDQLAFAALAGETLLGWVGGQPHYDGLVWELHPIVVRSDAQSRGVGRALVETLEQEVRNRGALTLWVGTDDDSNLTSIGGVDLFPDVLGKLAQIRNVRRHPLGFYQRLGFEVVGVVPDANGFGKPDILMAKRVNEQQSNTVR